MTETAKTYGGALYELARDESMSREMLEELDMCVKLFEDNPELMDILSLPSVPKKERCDVLNTCFSGNIHEYLLSFMKILVENGTIRQLADCTEAFRQRFYEDNGIVAVTAVTAIELKPELQEKLRTNLNAALEKTVKLNCRVDKSVLGGVRLEMDGKSLDGTVKSRLEKLQKSLNGTVL